MKRILIVFSMVILTTISSFSMNISEDIKSDSTVCITKEQLQYTNLIFAEHSRLLIENNLLQEQLKASREQLVVLDELRTKEIQNLNYTINDLNSSIVNKNKTIKGLTIGGISISIGLIILLLVK